MSPEGGTAGHFALAQIWCNRGHDWIWYGYGQPNIEWDSLLGQWERPRTQPPT